MRTMRYRRFGRTELQMPVLTCGGMRFQYAWNLEPGEKIPAESQERLERTVLRAKDVGINHFETARGYGTSEEQLGHILPRLPRDEIIVQTKVGIPEADPAEFTAEFEKSMSLLKLDHVDLLGLHGINNEQILHRALSKGGALERARQLQREGLVRFIGFSTHAPTQVIVDAVETGEFDYVNLHWYFVNDFNWAAVLAARARDMGVFIISPNDKGGKLYDPPEKLVQLCEPLSPMAFNDLYCLARPEVHTLSIGASRAEDFDEHLKAMELYDQFALLLHWLREALQLCSPPPVSG